MPCRYYIDTENRIAECTSYGKVTKEEVIQRLNRLLDDPDWVPGYHVISDYSAADFRHVTSSDLDELLSMAVKVREKIGQSKFAFVVPSDLHFAILRMWALKGGENIIELQAFNSRNQALAWLNQAETVPAG